MRKTASFGRNPLLEIGGPTVSQVNDLWRTFARGQGDPKRAVQRSLPAHHIWRTGDNISGYLFDGLSGGNEDVKLHLAAASNPYAQLMLTRKAIEQLRDGQ